MLTKHYARVGGGVRHASVALESQACGYWPSLEHPAIYRKDKSHRSHSKPDCTWMAPLIAYSRLCVTSRLISAWHINSNDISRNDINSNDINGNNV